VIVLMSKLLKMEVEIMRNNRINNFNFGFMNNPQCDIRKSDNMNLQYTLKEYEFDPEITYSLLLSNAFIEEITNLQLSKEGAKEIKEFIEYLKKGVFNEDERYSFYEIAENNGVVFLHKKYAVVFYVDEGVLLVSDIFDSEKKLFTHTAINKTNAIIEPQKIGCIKVKSIKPTVPNKVVAAKTVGNSSKKRRGKRLESLSNQDEKRGFAKTAIKSGSMVACKKTDAFSRIAKRRQNRNIKVDK